MKVSISQARSKLPQLVKELQRNPAASFEITVHNSVVAELRAKPLIKPGAAARKLTEVIRKLPKSGRRTRASEHVDAALYD